MRIPKFLLAGCAVAVCASFICARAADNPAQAAAQAALNQKMQELNGQSSQTNATPAAPQKESPPTQSAPVLVNSSGAVVVETPPTNQSAPKTAAPTAMTPPSGGSGLFEPVTPTPPNTEAQTAAQAALQQKMGEFNQGQMAAQPVASVTQPTFSSSSRSASSASYAAKEPGFHPIVAPPLPISASQEAQLQALTAKYMANEISPEAYFKQREEILGKP